MFGKCGNFGYWLTGILLAAGLSVSVAQAQQSSDESGAAGEPIDPNILYLQENAEREGVFVRPSGLQIRILTKGDGDLADPDSTVWVNYEGRLVDGTIFDSTYARGEPTSFPITNVIKGWTEALILMQVGSIWEIAIPASIGYGDDGAGDAIPPGATLIFKVELLGVQ